MEKIKVGITVENNVEIPKYMTEGAAGIDVSANIEKEIELENQAAQERINAMDEGFNKEQAQREFNNKKEKMVIEQVKRMTNEEVEDLMHMMEYMKDFMNGSFFKNI